jgi:hypothetical protein
MLRIYVRGRVLEAGVGNLCIEGICFPLKFALVHHDEKGHKSHEKTAPYRRRLHEGLIEASLVNLCYTMRYTWKYFIGLALAALYALVSMAIR